MATIERILLHGEDRIVLSGISWQMYEQLRENEENWHVHMAYDNGRLELMCRCFGPLDFEAALNNPRWWRSGSERSTSLAAARRRHTACAC